MAVSSFPLVEPRATISEALIERLVHAFYARIRLDEKLGPIFARKLSHRWDEHLATRASRISHTATWASRRPTSSAGSLYSR